MKIQLKNPGFIWIYPGFIHDLSRIYMDLSWFIHEYINDLLCFYCSAYFCFLLDSVLMPDSLTLTWWICFSVDVLEVVPNMSLEQGHVWDVWPEFAHTGSIHFSFQSMKYDACCCFGYRKATERQWTEESWAIVGLLYPDTKPVVEASSQTMKNIARKRPVRRATFNHSRETEEGEHSILPSVLRRVSPHVLPNFNGVKSIGSLGWARIPRGFRFSVNKSDWTYGLMTGLCGVRHRQWQRWEMFATSTHM